MPAYYLEALTVTLGIILLMAETFCSCKSKAWVGICAAVGLTVILGLTIIEGFGALFDPDFHIPVIGTWPIVGFLEDLFE